MNNRSVYYGGSPGPPRNVSRFPRHLQHPANQSFGPSARGSEHAYGVLPNGNYELQPQELSSADAVYYHQGENVISNNNLTGFGAVPVNTYPYGAPMDPFYYGGPTSYYYPHNIQHRSGFGSIAPYGYERGVDEYAEWSSPDFSAQMDNVTVVDPAVVDEIVSNPEARSSSNESVGKSRRFSRQRNVKDNGDGTKYLPSSTNKTQLNSASKHEIRFSHQKSPHESADSEKNMSEENQSNNAKEMSGDDARFSIIRSIGKRQIDTGFDKNEEETKVETKVETKLGKPRNIAKSVPSKARKSEKKSESQSGVLLDQLTAGTYECMVCCDRVKQQHAIWNCSKCYHVFHMGCIKKWARSPAATTEDEGWRCPGCQNASKKFPSTYFCFCGKVKEPEWNRRETPHSCGEVCGKKRRNSDTCTHPCNILCHPGPCPPCPASVIKKCLCGKMTRKVRCSQQKPLMCTEQCGKAKNCGVHFCDAVCHGGECNLCDILVAQVCYCGKSVRNIVCGTEGSRLSPTDSERGVYSCNLKCDKLLSCDNHACVNVCHVGECKPCPLLPASITTCPCSQTKLSDLLDEEGKSHQRTSCTDPILLCDKVCGKPLNCGGEDVHLCQLKCHEGECPPCADKESTVKCRCGKSEKDYPCSEIPAQPYICDRRCNKKRKCGRHKCGKTCCIDVQHVCSQTCGRKLECKIHRCEETCHRGNCHTCYNVSFDELTCHCGAEVVFPPIPCSTKPPECTQICMRQHSCYHPVNHNCHNEERCPPCVVLVKKNCNCGRLVRSNIPCHQENVSCGATCMKPLPCGHNCPKPCHQGLCITGDDVCVQPCSIMRIECIHPCANPCHHGNPCPSTPCKAMVTLKCSCGNLEKHVECSAGGATYQRLSSEAFARQQQLASGNSVDISTLFQGTGKQKILPCNEDCSAKQRNRRLAEALNIENPEAELGDQHHYSSFLLGMVKQDVIFVRNIEQELTNLVEAVEWLEKSRRNYTFPSMKREKRQVVHELAEEFNCKSLSVDEEPNRSVVVTAIRGICKVPRVLPSETIKKSPDTTSYGKRFASEKIKPSENSKRLLSSMKLVSMTSASPTDSKLDANGDLASKRPASIPRMPSYPSSMKSSASSSSKKTYQTSTREDNIKHESKNGFGSKNSYRVNSTSADHNLSQSFGNMQISQSGRQASKTSQQPSKKADEPDIDYFDMTG